MKITTKVVGCVFQSHINAQVLNQEAIWVEHKITKYST